MPDQSSVLYVSTARGRALIIRTIARRTTQLVSIDGVTGLLGFTFTPGTDVFASETAALEYLQLYYGPVEVLSTSQVVLGYVVIGPAALLLLADKLRTSATLPGNHVVKTVVTSKWHRIQLQQPEPDPITAKAMRDEMEQGISKTTSFPIDGAHFFCETFDLSRPFPSDRPVAQPSWEFVWNRWLSTGFRTAGLDFVCPQLMQGMCESRELSDYDGVRYHLALVSRRGRLHVGPRYKARGLNDYAEPGNEIECDQIIHRTPKNSKEAISWSRYTWRRGSVPLWWGVSIKNSGIGEAEIKIRPTNTFQGSRRYVRRLQQRYAPNPHLDPDPPAAASSDGSPLADPSLLVPVVFVSLLRKGTPEKDRSETKLASAFDFVVGALRKEHQLPLTYIALDWHDLDRQLGHDGIVEAFWWSMRGFIPEHGFALGTMTKVGKDCSDLAGQPVTPDELALGPAVPSSRLLHERGFSPAGQGWEVRWFRQQRGVVRYNCADSLDRTNVSSFFGAAQVMVEQCRELDIGIGSAPGGGADQLAAQRSRQLAAIAAAAAGQQNGVGGAGFGTSGRPAQLKTGFFALDKLSKGLSTMMHDLKSPMTARSDLRSDLCTMSVPNPALLRISTQPLAITLGSGGNAAGDPGALPEGWEAKVDHDTQKAFYIDHKRRATSWDRPTSSATAPSATSSPRASSPFDPVPLTPGSPSCATPLSTTPASAASARSSTGLWHALSSPLMMRPQWATNITERSPAAAEFADDAPCGASAPLYDDACGPLHLSVPPVPPVSPPPSVPPLRLGSMGAAAKPPAPPGPGPTAPLSIGAVGKMPDDDPKSLLRRLSRGASWRKDSGDGGVDNGRLSASALCAQQSGGSCAAFSHSQSSVDLSQLSVSHQTRPHHPEDADGAFSTTTTPRFRHTVDDLAILKAAAHQQQTAAQVAVSAVPASPGGHGVLAGGSRLRNGDLSRASQPRSAMGTDSGAAMDPDIWEPLTPWCLLPTSVKKFGRRVRLEALSALAELFLLNGDMSAWLYTGSQAMHSERILIFEPETSKLRRSGIGSYGNSLIAIKRRYNNVLVDTDKQMQIEIFLGMKHDTYFPSLPVPYQDSLRVPLEYPEGDIAYDVVAEIDWLVPDKAELAGHPGAGSASSLPAGSNGSFLGGSHNRPPCSQGRGKSFTSEKLFEELHRASATSGAGRPYDPPGGVARETVSECGPSTTWHSVSDQGHESDASSSSVASVHRGGIGIGAGGTGGGTGGFSGPRNGSTDQLRLLGGGGGGGEGPDKRHDRRFDGARASSPGTAAPGRMSGNGGMASHGGLMSRGGVVEVAVERTSAHQRTVNMFLNGVRKFADPLSGLLH